MAETDSDYFVRLLTPVESEIYSSAISSVEFAAAIARKQLSGELPAQTASLAVKRFTLDCEAGQIQMLPCGGDVLEGARNLASATKRRAPLLRSLDAIHISSALMIRPYAVVTTDARMRSIASLNGLNIFPEV